MTNEISADSVSPQLTLKVWLAALVLFQACPSPADGPAGDFLHALIIYFPLTLDCFNVLFLQPKSEDAFSVSHVCLGVLRLSLSAKEQK